MGKTRAPLWLLSYARASARAEFPDVLQHISYDNEMRLTNYILYTQILNYTGANAQLRISLIMHIWTNAITNASTELQNRILKIILFPIAEFPFTKAGK